MLDKVNVLSEQPTFEYVGCCPGFGQVITLYPNDLRNAKVGDVWKCEDQDCYPNREEWWTVVIKLVYRDDDGCLLIQSTEEESNGEKGMTIAHWIELH